MLISRQGSGSDSYVSFCFVSRWRSSVRDLMAFPLWGVEFISLVFKICHCYLNYPCFVDWACVRQLCYTLGMHVHADLCMFCKNPNTNDATARVCSACPEVWNEILAPCLPAGAVWHHIKAGDHCLEVGSGFSWKSGFRWPVWIGLFAAWHL